MGVDSRRAGSSYSHKPPKEDTVQYALLIYGSEDGWGNLSQEEQERQIGEYMALGQRPEMRGGADLGDLTNATTVRVNGGETLTTDGPFAETKEYLGGFYLVECDTIDEAIEFASKIPAARTGGAIEVRPVVEH
jgi:hypothetical protein